MPMSTCRPRMAVVSCAPPWNGTATMVSLKWCANVCMLSDETVPTPADVDAWAEHLEAHGVTLEARPKTHRDGSRSLYFHGPQNLLVQIIHHLPMT